MTDITTTITPLSLGDDSQKISLVKFSGQLDETNVDEEAKKIYEIIESTNQNPILIFDLNNLTYLNSKSIGYFTDWYSKATEKGGKIILAAPRENILDILKVVGLTNILEITLTLEEAKLSALKPA